MPKVFLSHTKYDGRFCDRFDNICSNVGMGRFRSEFEEIDVPSWLTIKEQMDQSRALFLLVGHELVKQQASPNDPGWKFTQNWISYEVGLAHQRGIDVWVVCDSVGTNFPVPYFNNYAPFGLEPGNSMQYMNLVLREYLHGGRFPTSNKPNNITITCLTCGIGFNLHAALETGQHVVCPQCLHGIEFDHPFASELRG
jgi:hypothetical protein